VLGLTPVVKPTEQNPPERPGDAIGKDHKNRCRLLLGPDMLRSDAAPLHQEKDSRSPRTYVWPPTWEGPDGLRGAGVLTHVRRFGHRLSLTVRFDRKDHVALLDEWKPPPPIDAVEAALSTMIGKRVGRLGEIEVGSAVPLPRPDPAGY
jgi:hypothetical protein